MQNIRVVIADDEVYALKNLEFELEQFNEIEIVGKTNKALEIIGLVRKLQPDLLFMDINMPKMNGLQVIDELQSLGICPPVVLVTAHADYSLEAYKRFVFNYLLKPVDTVQLQKIIHRFSMNMAKPDKTINKLKFNCRSGSIIIEADDVLGLEADGNYTTIYLTSGQKETVTKQLGRVEKLLPVDTFFRCSKSCTVNLDYLSFIDRSTMELLLNSGSVKKLFPISVRQMAALDSLL